MSSASIKARPEHEPASGPGALQHFGGTPWRWPLETAQPPTLSSTYGPRLQFGAGLRYDYHQGIDLPTPLDTPVLAALSGTVRIAGSHPSYQDGIVQLDHGDQLYSNYIHVSESLVTVGQVVSAGTPIALSGADDNGFAHLHFEIRDGSLMRSHAVHPLRYLPVIEDHRHAITVTDVLATHAVAAQITAWPEELAINEITLSVRDGATGAVIDSRVLNFEARNRSYQGDPARLDNPDLEQMHIAPQRFGTASTIYRLDITFDGLLGSGPVTIEACAIDVHGVGRCDTRAGVFAHRQHLPLILRR